MSRPYGRRPPYRRRDRLGFAGTASLMVFGVLAMVAVWFSIPAHADPVTPNVAIYAAKNAGPVCNTLDAYPSIPGLKGVLAGVGEDGFTAAESGQIVALAVQAQCPRFIPLLEQFINIYAPPSRVSAVPPSGTGVIA